MYQHIEQWRNRELKCSYPYVYLDGIYLKTNRSGQVENVSVLVALAVDQDGYIEIIGACEGSKEDTESWLVFLRNLKERGLNGTKLFVGDKCLGLLDEISSVFPQSKYQRCVVHFYRNVLSVTAHSKMSDVAAMLNVNATLKLVLRQFLIDINSLRQYMLRKTWKVH